MRALRRENKVKKNEPKPKEIVETEREIVIEDMENKG